MKRGILVAAVGLAAACANPPVETAPIEPIGDYIVLGQFSGSVSGGQLVLEPVGETGEGLHSRIRVVKTRSPGGNPDNTIELVTESVGFDEAGCGVPDSHCGLVTMRSFYAGQLTDIWVRILRMWPASGFEGENSDPDTSGENMGRTGYGLWFYGDLAPGGESSKTWIFRQPADQDFRFYGEVRARVPAPATVTGTLNIPGATVRRAFQDTDNLAYLAAGAAGVQVADVTNPPSPNVLGAYTEPNMDCTDVTKIGNVAYAAGGPVGVKCVNVQTPTNPTLIGTINVPGATTVASLGNALYVGVGGDVQIWNVTDPLNPVFVGLLGANNASTIVRVIVDGVRIYCLYRNGQAFVADATSPFAPTPLATIPSFAGNATDLQVRNGIAYCGYDGGPGVGGLLIADWRDPVNPQQIWWDGGSRTIGVGVFGRTLACVYGDGRFVTAGLADLSNPTILSSAFTPGTPSGVSVLRNGFGLCAYGSQVQLLDTPPFVVKTMPVSGGEGVCPDDNLQLFFSANLDPATVTPSTVQVRLGGQPVDGTLSVSGNVVTFDPAQPLAQGSYEFRVTEGVRNTRGTAAAPYDGGFTASGLCIEWEAFPTAPVASSSLITFQYRVSGATPTSARVRISLDENPADPFAPSTIAIAQQSPTDPGLFIATFTAPTVTANTRYYAVPEVIIGAQRRYGEVRSYVVTPANQPKFTRLCTNPNAGIAGNGSAIATIDVTSVVGTVVDLDVVVTITHPEPWRLSMNVVHSADGFLMVAPPVFQCPVGNMSVIFDDEAQVEAPTCNPFNTFGLWDRQSPFEPLSFHDGTPTNGIWQLNVFNTSPLQGVLQTFCVNITYN